MKIIEQQIKAQNTAKTYRLAGGMRQSLMVNSDWGWGWKLKFRYLRGPTAILSLPTISPRPAHDPGYVANRSISWKPLALCATALICVW
jgi:hypothetical protein